MYLFSMFVDDLVFNVRSTGVIRTGSIPADLGRLHELTNIDFSRNLLAGESEVQRCRAQSAASTSLSKSLPPVI